MSDETPYLSDEQIEQMTPDERRALVVRLARPLTEVVADTSRLHTRRRIRLGIMAGAAILLVPWIIYLAVTLPPKHQVRTWTPLWVGFDVIELVLLAVTFLMLIQRRAIGLLTAFATGVVLLCDVWFDVFTSARGDRWESVLAAVLIEIPLALLLMSPALRALRVVPALLWLSEPDARSWQIRLPALGRRTPEPPDS